MKANRKDAMLNGDLYYFTGQSCKNGHVAKRYTRNCECVECRKEYAMKYASGQTYDKSEVIVVLKELGQLALDKNLRDTFVEFERYSSRPDILVQLEAIRDNLKAMIASSLFTSNQ